MWASYAIFAVATILLGAIVGLALVCVIDCIWPQKHIQRQTFSEVKEKGKLDDGDEIKGDELEEDESDSEGEKISNSESDDAPESDSKNTPKATPTSSPDVRKRKTRKAD